MKIIRIDDDNFSKIKYLAEKDNRSMSNYLTTLLNKALGGSSESEEVNNNKVPPENISNKNSAALPTANKVGGPAPFVPRPPDPETGYPCCLLKRPCKHWVWDGNSGVWTNLLTGRVRENDI